MAKNKQNKSDEIKKDEDYRELLIKGVQLSFFNFKEYLKETISLLYIWLMGIGNVVALFAMSPAMLDNGFSVDVMYILIFCAIVWVIYWTRIFLKMRTSGKKIKAMVLSTFSMSFFFLILSIIMVVISLGEYVVRMVMNQFM